MLNHFKPTKRTLLKSKHFVFKKKKNVTFCYLIECRRYYLFLRLPYFEIHNLSYIHDIEKKNSKQLTKMLARLKCVLHLISNAAHAYFGYVLWWETERGQENVLYVYHYHKCFIELLRIKPLPQTSNTTYTGA